MHNNKLGDHHGATLPEDRSCIPLRRGPAGHHDGHFPEFRSGAGACAHRAARLGHAGAGGRDLSPASVGGEDAAGAAALLGLTPGAPGVHDRPEHLPFGSSSLHGSRDCRGPSGTPRTGAVRGEHTLQCEDHHVNSPLALVTVLSALLMSGQAAAQEHVTLQTPDGATIAADLYGAGARGVVLAHGGRLTKADWAPPARILPARRFLRPGFALPGLGEPAAPPPALPGA